MTQKKPCFKFLSTKSGVYRFFNSEGQLIYVGKARNLKKRISSYFRTNLDNLKTISMMSQVEDIEVTITEDETEALILETNIIKEYHPRYNVLMRDDKSYPYLFFSRDSKFPRLDYNRGTKKKSDLYFGPYPNFGSVRENLALIQKLFLVRQCKDVFFHSRSRPCLQYQIKRCTAPCVGFVDQENYLKQVNNAILFLEGKNDTVIQNLQSLMDAASRKLDYEKAAQFRDQIRQLRGLQKRQFMIQEQGNIDVFASEVKDKNAAVAVLFVRFGRVMGHKVFYPKVTSEMSEERLLMNFILYYYSNPIHQNKVLNAIVVSVVLREKKSLKNFLTQHLSSKIKVIDKPRSVDRQWRLMAKQHARYGLLQFFLKKNDTTMKLRALQKALNLPKPIDRIECFDVSHTQGSHTVASCVVYGVEGALNRKYRNFNIKTAALGDDYAAIHEAMMRRYRRLQANGSVLPNLVIVDGGKSHLKQAETVFEKLQITGVELIAIAKGPSRKPGLEKIWRSSFQFPLDFSDHHEALHLVQFIVGEAHRFSVQAHRNQRKNANIQSPLECIKGIGIKRRRALLRYFGGLQCLKKASVKEIAKVPGMSDCLSERVYEALR